MGQMIEFKGTSGKPYAGYLVEPADAKAPGVVVIQEWWGLQGQIKSMADRLAGAGFRALAPDLYQGKVIPYHDAAAASATMGTLDFLGSVDDAVRGAVKHLAANGAKVGLTGFCMGGAITIIGAVRIPELSAAVCFYGIPPEAAAAPKDLRVPLQAHFASDDDWCTPAVVDAFEQKVKAAGKQAEIFRYQAHHAFMNEQRTNAYDAASAKQGWERCVQFFRKHLG
jgi:carboxymethylenebutenolidase